MEGLLVTCEILPQSTDQGPSASGQHRRGGNPVAVTIDSSEWPYHVLSIRGTASVERVEGVLPEYAAAARRYFGEEQGKAWVDQLPPALEMWRIAVTPTWANVLDFETRFPSALSGG